VLVNVGADGKLDPGEVVTIRLEFTNPTRAAITYAPRLVSGAPR
jgi:hypothetical protein